MENIHNDQILKFKNEMSGMPKAREGKVVQRYNIPEGALEYYFIPSDQVEEYENAHSRQEMEAHKKYGTQLNRDGF